MYKQLIQRALKEDIGRGDITTQALIPHLKVRAVIIAKESGIICGLNIAQDIFKALDKHCQFRPEVKDGQKIKRGQIIVHIKGNARAILTAERTALNFLSFLSGISTKTKKFVEAVKPHKVKILDTRKTLPGLRILEKYAVRVGGGFNHRIRLDEMILIKDNHLKVARSYQNLSKLIRGYPVEIEVKNLKEFRQILPLRPDIIMLDNMSIKEIRKAVCLRNSLSKTSPKLEASGGINLNNLKKIAATGVDMISIGELTHSVESLDLSLKIL